MRSVEVQLFGAFRQYGQGATVQVALDEPATIADLRSAFARELDSEEATALLKASAFADDERVLAETDPVPVGGALAVLPPVCGG